MTDSVWGRTCFMIDSLERGGAQRQLFRMAQTLVSQGRDTFNLIVFRPPLTYREELEALGVTVTLVDKTAPFDLKFFAELVTTLKRMAPRSVVTFLPTADLWGRLAALLAEVPVIGCSVRSMPVSLGVVKDALLSWLDRRSCYIVCNSRAAAEQLVMRGGRYQDVVTYIPNGIESRDTCSSGDRPCFRIGIVARLVPVKKIGTLLNAVARLKEHGGFELVIVGDGEERSSLEQLTSELDLRSQVTFTGEISDPWSLICSFSVGVISSEYEGLSNVIMEYMLAGLPVVATRVGGNTELVIDRCTGFLYEPDDAQGLADHLLTLKNDAELAGRLGQHGRERILSEYTLESLVAKWELLLTTHDRTAGVEA